MKGKISKTGYRKNSPDKDNDFNVIPSGRISMKDVEHPVYGIDENGEMRMMYPGEEHQFGGNNVLEIPMKKTGGPSQSKAKEILRDGTAHGKELTDAQKRFFGWIAGGRKEDGGEMRHGGQRNIKNRSKTSKNIKSSMNELFLRNYDVYGLPGKHIYDPKAKEGGPTMNYYPIPPHYFVNNYGQKVQPTWYQTGGDTDGDYDFDNSEDYDQVEMRKGGMPQWLYEARGRAMRRAMDDQFGGEIDDDGDVDYRKKGGIHIDPSKKGTFTAAATKHKMGVQEFARHVMANKSKFSSAMVKKANFARNAAKWHHQFGGQMMEDDLYQMGGDFSTWKVEQLKKGYKQVPGAEREFYDPKMYTPSSQTDRLAPWTATGSAPLTTGNYPATTFTYTAPKTATIPKASTYIDTSSNPYHQVSFGQNPMYVDKRTGQTVPASIVMKERQAQVGPGMKQGGQPCFECGGNAMMEGGGEYLKSLLKAAYRDVTKRQKGGSAPQGYTMDDILAKRNNTFKNYIANNTLYAMAMEEVDNLDKLHQMYKQYGGSYYQTGGNFTPADSLDDAFEFQSYVHPAMTTQTIGNNVMGPNLKSDYDFTGQPVTPSLPSEQGQIANVQMSPWNYMSQDIQKASMQQGPQVTAKQPNWFQRNAGPGMAEGILTGANFLTAALNARNTRANEQLLKQNTLADKMFQSNPTRNRGDYEVNSGTLRPNQYNTSQYAKGGQFDMDQKEIDRLKALGYRVEIIDLID